MKSATGNITKQKPLRSLGFWICSMMLISGISAQSVKEDLALLNKTYLNASSFSMDVQVDMFRNLTDTRPEITYKGTVKKDGNQYFNEIMNQITLINSRCHLIVNKNSKRIVYKPSGNTKTAKEDLYPAKMLDSLLKKYKAVNLVRSDAGKRTYEFILFPGQSIYDKILISIDVKNYTLLSVEYFYKGDAEYRRVYIAYHRIEINKPVPQDVFNENKYIMVSNGQIKPAAAFSQFKVIKVKPNEYIGNE